MQTTLYVLVHNFPNAAETTWAPALWHDEVAASISVTAAEEMGIAEPPAVH